MKQKSLTGFMNEVIEELCQQERFATAPFTRMPFGPLPSL